MAKMTSAYANKVIRKLQEDKEFWLNKEKEGFVYIAALDEEPVIPDQPVEPEVPTHQHTTCPTCGKCTAEDCPDDKCQGHTEDTKKSGCAAGAYIVSALLPICFAFVFIKRKKQ